ncbi:MAG: peptidylprolyl isomerase, partial [Bacteroidota bacterium]
AVDAMNPSTNTAARPAPPAIMAPASAGNHTEGVQFFITHAPTPHLDGIYTIFAKVVKGMEIVHQIQVNDVIEQVQIVTEL